MPPRKRTKAKDQRRVVRRTKTVYASGAAEVPEVFLWQYIWGKDHVSPSFVLTVDGGKYVAMPKKMEVWYEPDQGKQQTLGRFSVGGLEVQKAVKGHMRGERSVWQRVKQALQSNPHEAVALPTADARRAWVRKVARKHKAPVPNPDFVDWLFGIERKHTPEWKRFYVKQGKKNREMIALFKKLKVPYRNLGYDQKGGVFTIGVDVGYIDGALSHNKKLDVTHAINQARVRPVMMAPGVKAWMPERLATANPARRLRQILQQVPRRRPTEAEAFQRGQEDALDVIRASGLKRWHRDEQAVIQSGRNPYAWGSREYDAWWDGVTAVVEALTYVTPGGAKRRTPRKNAKKKTLSRSKRAAILRQITGAR